MSAGIFVTNVEEWFYSFARDDLSAAIDPMKVNELNPIQLYITEGRYTPKEIC